MKSPLAALAIAGVVTIATPTFAGGIPTFDAATVAQLQQQFRQLQQEYEMLKQQYAALTGSYGRG